MTMTTSSYKDYLRKEVEKLEGKENPFTQSYIRYCRWTLKRKDRRQIVDNSVSDYSEMV